MPVYLYRNLRTQEEFEVAQGIADPKLTAHPETGDPVQRLITAPNLNMRHTPGRTKALLSAENIAAKGFTRYEKAGGGRYVRTAGTQGPAEFRK